MEGIYVLTGGLATGKTEIIKSMSRKGFSTLSELEQEVLDEFFVGRNPKENPELYALEWFKKKRDQYDSLSKNGVYFSDRSFLDALAIYPFLNLPIPKNLDKDLRRRRFSSPIFIIEPIPIRFLGNIWPRKILTQEESMRFSKVVESQYVKEGYEVIKIPGLKIEERVKLILEKTTQNSSRRISPYLSRASLE